MYTDTFIGYGYLLSGDDVRRLFTDENGDIRDTDNLWQIDDDNWFYGKKIRKIDKYGDIVSLNQVLNATIAESSRLSESIWHILNNVPMEDIAARWSNPDIFIISRFVD